MELQHKTPCMMGGSRRKDPTVKLIKFGNDTLNINTRETLKVFKP